jgi:hypothetical protein
MTDNKKPHTAGTGTASKTAFNDPHSTKTDPTNRLVFPWSWRQAKPQRPHAQTRLEAQQPGPD